MAVRGGFSPAEILLAELAENPTKSTQQSGKGQRVNAPRLSSPDSPWTNYHLCETTVIISFRNLLTVFPAAPSCNLVIATSRKEVKVEPPECRTEGLESVEVPPAFLIIQS